MNDAPPSDTEVMRALADVMGAGVFGANSRQPRLLRYLVQTELEGQGERLKAYAIATEALGRGDSFDPATDSIVRVEVNRLRQSLAHYYATEGADAGLVIEIPKGQYRPVFRKAELAAADTGVTADVTRRTQRAAARRWPAWAWVLAGSGGVAVIAAVVAIVLTTWGGGPPDIEATVQGGETGPPPADEPTASTVAVGQRPSFPRIFTKADSSAPVVGLIMLAVQNVASRFDSARVMTGVSAPDPRARWPEDYQIEVTALPGEEGVSVFLRLVHLQSGELVDSREVRVSGLELDALDLENRLAVQRETARFVDIGGVVGQDYLRRGDYSPTMRCALLMQDYLNDKNGENFHDARLCAEAEIGGGNREPYLYALLAFLYLESDLGFGAPDGEEDRANIEQAALRAAQSAVTRDPASANAHLAQMMALLLLGDEEAAVRSGNRAVELNPFSSGITGAVGLHFCYLEHYRRGLELLERSAELQGDALPWRAFGLFLAHYGLGEQEQAAASARLLAGTRNPYFITAAIVAAQIDGDAQQAARLAAGLGTLDPNFAADPRAALTRHRLPPAMVEDFLAALAAAGLDSAAGDGGSR